jgi:biopolymer transport protein ExbD
MKLNCNNYNSKNKINDSDDKILPLINVVFLLIIFFMITGSLGVTEPFNVDAPQSQNNNAIEVESFKISLSENGELALNAEPMTEENILAHIKQGLLEHPDSLVELKADRGIPGNHIIILMNQLRDIGVKKISLLTQSVEV